MVNDEMKQQVMKPYGLHVKEKDMLIDSGL